MKVLVVGLGAVGQRHVRNLRTLLGAKVEILAYRVRRLPHVVTNSLTVSDGMDVEHEYGVHAFEELEDALAADPEAAFVCNPTSLHIDIATRLAAAGCHLFIEKPLSHTWDGVERLIASVESQQLIAAVGCQLRLHPCLKRLRELLQLQAIGNVTSVLAEYGEYLPAWHPYEDYRQSFAAKEELGGGVLLSQIHEFDYLCWLFGSPRCVFAVGGHLSRLEVNVEDSASVLLGYQLGNGSVPVYVHQDYLQVPPRRRCRIVGDAGRIEVDFNVPALEHYGPSGELVERLSNLALDRNDLFLTELEDFLHCVCTGSAPLVSLRDAAQSLRVVLAAKQSLNTGQVVELSSFLALHT